MVYTWDIPGIYSLSEYTWYIHGIYRLYTSSGFQMKWVDIFQVYVGIFQTYWYRPSGQIYGIFQEYVRISNFYGFQMVPSRMFFSK
jgi:hypothetical protein